MLLNIITELDAQTWITTTSMDIFNYIGYKSDLITLPQFNNKSLCLNE